MGWFCARPKKSEKKKSEYLKKIQYSGQDFDVKLVYVNLTMSDGTTFTTTIYGSFHQNYGYGRDGNDWVTAPQITTALENARGFISCISTVPQTYVDDSKQPTKCVVGNVVKASIDLELGEISYVEKHMVASLIEQKIEIT